jgi:hypothetical protein
MRKLDTGAFGHKPIGDDEPWLLGLHLLECHNTILGLTHQQVL